MNRSVKQAEKKATKWLYGGGGGNEVEKGDENCMTVTFWGLCSYLASYAEYLASETRPQKEK